MCCDCEDYLGIKESNGAEGGVSHTYCEGCAEEQLRQLQSYRESKKKDVEDLRIDTSSYA